MTRLEEVNGLVAEKRGKMGDLLKKRNERDTKAFTDEERNTFLALNKELDALSKEQESLQLVEKAVTETEAYLSGQESTGTTGGGLPHASGIKTDLLGEIKLKDDKGNLRPESEIKEELDRRAQAKAAELMLAGMGGGGQLDTPERRVEMKAAAIATSFVESAAFKQYSKVSKKSPETEVDYNKALFSTASFPIQSIRSNIILPIPTRRLVVADLMPQGNITQPRFLYVVETVATNNAAPVAEGGTKPESALTFAEESADVRKIATVLPVTDEMFEDAPLMRSYVQGRLVTFLQLAEENQLLNGSGVAPNLLGILNNPAILSGNKGADSIADAIYKASTQIMIQSQLNVSGIIMHPLDWQTVRLSKDGNGQYLFGSPLAGDIERIFGYPVVKTVAIAQGTALPGAFDLAVMLLRRTGIAFAVATEHADFFIKNQLMLRVEERVAMPTFRPQGFYELNLLA
jgi:HK97 family phage major capsid protein